MTSEKNMKKITATIPAASQKDGIAFLAIEFDNGSAGWYLYGHKSLDSAAEFEMWNMSEEDAKEMASADYGVTSGDWSDGEDDANAPTLDSNGAVLNDGDNVTLIKDLPVKGAGVTIKRGTMVKNISLTNNPEEIDCKTKEVKGLVLKTCFVKKV